MDMNIKVSKLYRYFENRDGTVGLMFGFRYVSMQEPIPKGNETLQQSNLEPYPPFQTLLNIISIQSKPFS